MHVFVHFVHFCTPHSITICTMSSANSSIDSGEPVNISFDTELDLLSLSLDTSVPLATQLGILRDISAAAASGTCTVCSSTVTLLDRYRAIFANERALLSGSLLPADFDIGSSVNVFWPATETVWKGEIKDINAIRMTCTVVFVVGKDSDDAPVEEEAHDMPLSWVIVAP